MIHKNAKVGKIENVTVCLLGQGDVRVNCFRVPNGGTAGVSFVNDVPREIGAVYDDAGTTSDESGIDIVLEFSDERSIDVVEGMLKKVRELLLDTATAL